MFVNNLKVLVAPLDWGLGHATRCIPVINTLLKCNAEVFISANGDGRILLEKEFPHLTFIEISGIKVSYPRKGNMMLSMLSQMPGFLRTIKKEYNQLQDAIIKYKITHVISDNRYGMFSKNAKTAFITHQVHIRSSVLRPIIEPFLFLLNRYFIEKFDALWIPDIRQGTGLSGQLSSPANLKIKSKCIGILSRFNGEFKSGNKRYDIIALLSGPEPQRTAFEKKLIAELENSGRKYLLVRGKPAEQTVVENKNIISSITSRDLCDLLHPETILVARPGYSTIMDMAMLGHEKLLLVPTPGQTEQEYLATYLAKKYNCSVIHQHQKLDFNTIRNCTLSREKNSPDFLFNAITGFLSK